MGGSFFLFPSAVDMTFSEYQIIGRLRPTEDTPNPTLYRMRIFAPNDEFGSSWHTVVSHPAVISINTHVAHNLAFLTNRGSRNVANWRTREAPSHTEISHPAATVSSHVTSDLPIHTLAWCWVIADHGTGSLWHTVISHPASSNRVPAHITEILRSCTVGWKMGRAD